MSPARQRQPIETFLVWDQATCALGSMSLLIVYLTSTPDQLLLFESALVALTGAAMGLARRPLRRGETSRAVIWIAAASGPVLVLPGAITPFVEPILVASSLLPLVIAVPYVSSRQLLGLGAWSTTAAVTAAFVARVEHPSARTDQLPGWLPDVVVAVFLPAAIGLISLISAHNHRSLNASRARVIASTDQARRRIERDLHDGAQQRLVAVTMQLGLAADLVHENPAVASRLLADLSALAEQALAELRNLCLGVYPTVLTDFGLADALRAITATPTRHWQTEAEDVGRFDEAVEAAVYFACIEAVQNAVKHAGPNATITIGCARAGTDRVRFWVGDDGSGFATDQVRPGTGLVSIEDRIGAVGGSVRILSRPGDGTRVMGSVPARAAPPERSEHLQPTMNGRRRPIEEVGEEPDAVELQHL